jgi:hypothetical protein
LFLLYYQLPNFIERRKNNMSSMFLYLHC